MAKSVGRPLAGAVVTVLALTATGTASADNGQDAGPNRNDSRRQADKPAAAARPDNKHADGPGAWSAPKPGATLRDAPLQAAFDARSAAAMQDALEDIAGFIAPAAQQAVFGGSVPTVGMGGLVPNARALAAYISNAYPGVQAIGGVRADPLPDHPSGHAIDIMIGSDMGLGDAINADVQGQGGRFGVVYTLWRVPNHFNHVHVTVS